MLGEVLDRPPRTLTERSMTDPARLRRELAEVRRNGFAVEREEAALGSCCVAAPVLTAAGPVAAVSVSTPWSSSVRPGWHRRSGRRRSG